MRHLSLLIFATLLAQPSWSQTGSLTGNVQHQQQPLPWVAVGIEGLKIGAVTDSSGQFQLQEIPAGRQVLSLQYLGYAPKKVPITILPGQTLTLGSLEMEATAQNLAEVVVSGTLRELNRLDSPVPVEVYQASFFRQNPTPSLFEALQNVNGIRPQLNCNVCNTGDVHINGLEGPYTLVLLDGMPIVSSLSTVYGLFGIPNALIERVEVVKGPASSLYGSEAVGGLINVITKQPQRAPRFSAEFMGTSWSEWQTDLGATVPVGKKITLLQGIHYFDYSQPQDHNNDNFTDVTLQERVSIFQKWQISRPQQRLFSLAGRFFYEDRWGGAMNFSPTQRGSDEVYGESIYTQRWELLGNYQLPTREKLFLAFSFNDHRQDSYYGPTPYLAHQRIAFSQLTWHKKLGAQELLAGAALRHTYYDDNTPATADDQLGRVNQPERVLLPGLFAQTEWTIGPAHQLLAGLRYDHHPVHGSIFTPRLAFKWQVTPNDLLRINTGTGFRVVSLFTEDHAALTGAREVRIEEDLRPERSVNVNLNYHKKFYWPSGSFLGLEFSIWHTHFNNLILPDYLTDPNAILYNNLDGRGRSQGLSLNAETTLASGWDLRLGLSWLDVSTLEQGIRTRQPLTERWSGTWALGYQLPNHPLRIDYTGVVYGPMILPLLGPLDPRRPTSPVWSLQNIQCTYAVSPRWEVFGGIKNLLNWTPNQGNPFLIARANDPFDRQVQFDAEGQVVPTPDNPYALTFDPTYAYGPNQGRRGFLGLRYNLR